MHPLHVSSAGPSRTGRSAKAPAKDPPLLLIGVSPRPETLPQRNAFLRFVRDHSRQARRCVKPRMLRKKKYVTQLKVVLARVPCRTGAMRFSDLLLSTLQFRLEDRLKKIRKHSTAVSPFRAWSLTRKLTL